MRFRVVRALVTVAAFLAAWLLVRPAEAAPSGSMSNSMSMIASFFPASFIPADLLSKPPEPSEVLEVPTSKAPLCDPRGATMVAPAPQMQEAELSLESALVADDCFGSAATARLGRAAPGGGSTAIDASTAVHPAHLSAGLRLVRPWRELLPAPVGGLLGSRPGTRSTVDRPPRAHA